ncbi:hypothetical protein GCM10023080_026310 [Streptomyces pseudoechinosporeus]
MRDIADDVGVQGPYETVDGGRVSGAGGERPGSRRLVERRHRTVYVRLSAFVAGGGQNRSDHLMSFSGHPASGTAARTTVLRHDGRVTPLADGSGSEEEMAVRRVRPMPEARVSMTRHPAAAPGNRLSQTTAVPAGGPRGVIE